MSERVTTSVDRNSVMEALKSGISGTTLLGNLQKQGWEEADAQKLVQLCETRLRVPAIAAPEKIATRNDAAWNDIFTGGGFLIAGVGITVATYIAAASVPGGGKYILAYGPAIFGTFRLFRGLGRL